MVDLKGIDFAKIGTEIVSRPLDENRNEKIEDLTPKQ